jgi:hypothetical protein
MRSGRSWARSRRRCDPANPDDDHCGDYWDRVAFDPEHNVVLALVPGSRTEENAREIVAEVKQRLGGQHPELMTSDEYPVYAHAIKETFGEPVAVEPERHPGRPRILPESRLPDDLVSATVHTHRENNRVVAVDQRLIFGTQDKLESVGRVVGELPREHLVRRASERDRPWPRREEDAEDVPVQQGLAGA